MIRRLYLDHCFRHRDRTFTFEKGLTGVIGPNESGKSLIVEMIRYALFGSKALRGAASDYQRLHVELDFEVRGTAYSVVRKGPRTTLHSDGQQVSGTRPVNEAIQRILGYDLTVFDVANACNQGDVEKLTTMRPAERKQMVDQTVGLNVLDSVIAYCGNEGNALKREAEGVASVLVEPVAPTEPEGFVPVSKIEPKVREAGRMVAEFNQLTGALAHRPSKPKRPGKCSVPEKLETLLTAQEERTAALRALEGARRLAPTLKQPVYSAEKLDEVEAQWEQFDLWRQKRRLLDRGEHRCPKCDHTWPVASDDLADYADVTEVQEPGIDKKILAVDRSLQGNVQKLADLERQIFEYEEVVSVRPDVSGQIATVRAHEADMKTYEAAKTSYDAFMKDVSEKEARLEELSGASAMLDVLNRSLEICRNYERDLSNFEKENQRYVGNLKRYNDLKQKSEALLTSRTAIQELKAQVKSHLLPSLNKVASVLLGQMTGGERYKVEIDQDFEIMIDDQPIVTLSGSGKAVANLAIRIALGQILTNRVFSVFLADEVDAAMDDERAEYTVEALRRLTTTVGQVVQVTHKKPETDNTIELKK